MPNECQFCGIPNTKNALNMSESADSGYMVFVDDCEINLKNRYFAAVLAFLVPGAGHFYQGRRNKAYLFAVCILSLFFLGLFVGQGRVVYAAWNPEEYRIQFPAQMCVGVPAFPAAIQGWIHRDDAKNGFVPQVEKKWSWSRFMAAPADGKELSDWHLSSSAGFELGTLYTAVAGLLNLLAIFDAYAGPMPLPTTDERRKKKTQ